MHMPFPDERTPIRGLEERIEALVEARTLPRERGLALSAHRHLLDPNDGPDRNVRGRWLLIIGAIVLPLIILGAGLFVVAQQNGFAASILGGTSKIPTNVGHVAPIFNTGNGITDQPVLPAQPAASAPKTTAGADGEGDVTISPNRPNTSNSSATSESEHPATFAGIGGG